MDVLFVIVVIVIAVIFVIAIGSWLEPYFEHLSMFESMVFSWVVIAAMPWSLFILLFFGDEIKQALAKRPQ